MLFAYRARLAQRRQERANIEMLVHAWQMVQALRFINQELDTLSQSVHAEMLPGSAKVIQDALWFIDKGKIVAPEPYEDNPFITVKEY